MNVITKKELSKVKLADLSNFDKSALVYSIPKYTEFHYEQNKCYLIKLNNSITNPSQDSTLASNYNNGKIPEYSYYYVDVLKVGHHGSRTSTSEEFIEQTKPEVAIISLGKNNSYGHPHKEVKELLEEYDISIYRTDTEGTIHVVSDGKKYEIETLQIHLDGDKNT